MPELIPFAALRYSDRAGDMSRLIAPPYDVIDAEEALELRHRSPHNCIRLILPEGPPGERYQTAARTLERWTSEGILAPDREPSIYVYRQTFQVRGTEVNRHAVFGALRLTPFEDGEVLPHERTHAGPKKDRLALTLATRAQLSPIFLIARDPEGAVREGSLAATSAAAEFAAATPDGMRHELWRLRGDAAGDLCSAVGAEPLLIADGHHRYETALAAAAELSDNVKAAFLLVCVVSQRDPGLAVQPTHRVLVRAPDGRPDFDWPGALERRFEVTALGDVSPTDAEARAAREGKGALVVLPATGERTAYLATPTDSAGEGLADPQSLRLAPVVFDELVLRELYGRQADAAAHSGDLAYVRTPESARRTAGPGGCAFLLPPVALDDVWTRAAAGGRLPQKSTYFEPKIPSGLLFRSL